MTPPGFSTDTDALRWYGTQCRAAAEQVDHVRHTEFESRARIPDSAWGGQIMQLTLLKTTLDRLRDSYDRARAATATRLDKAADQLAVTDTNLHRVAHSYEVTDRLAAGRMPK